MPVKQHYRRIIRDIMAERGVSPATGSPGHMVQANTGLNEVLQHTDFYIGEGGDAQAGARPHYRYDRYQEIMGLLEVSKGRGAHIDIGCGAGLFSWVFYDWAAAQGFDPSRIDLYGFDNCSAMLDLAQEVRDRLIQEIPTFPEMHYHDNVEELLQKLTVNHHEGIDYTITFGHVLVQAQTGSTIHEFTRVISHIVETIDQQSNCVLIAVDARWWSSDFAIGWNSLLNSLDGIGVRYEERPVPVTQINDNSRAKFARIHTG